MEVDIPLTLDCEATDLKLKKSLIKHPFAGLGVFEPFKFGRGRVVNFFYRCLVQLDLSNWPHFTSVCGE